VHSGKQEWRRTNQADSEGPPNELSPYCPRPVLMRKTIALIRQLFALFVRLARWTAFVRRSCAIRELSGAVNGEKVNLDLLGFFHDRSHHPPPTRATRKAENAVACTAERENRGGWIVSTTDMLCAVRLDQRSSPPWISCTPNDNSRLTWRDGTKPPVGTGIGMSTVRMATRVAADSLRRLTEGSQKRATHSVGIGKTGFSCNDVNWQPSLLNHETRSFQPQILDSLRG